MSVDEEKVEPLSCDALEEAVTFMKKAYEVMNQQAIDVRKEKEALESVAKKLEHVHFASTITLNVGGQRFTTSLQTITKDKGGVCWFSTLLREVFLRELRFSPLLKNQHLIWFDLIYLIYSLPN